MNIPSDTAQGNKNWLIGLLAGTLLFIAPALYNGFPMVTPDSGAYVGNAYELTVPLDRALGYSVFIRASSLGLTLWGCIAVQALLLAALLQILMRHLLGSRYSGKIFIAACLLVTFCTSAAWFCSQLMPDIFTAILLLCVMIWHMVPLSKAYRALLAVFLFCVLMLHNAHPLILASMSILLMIHGWMRKNRTFQKNLVLLALSISALLGFCTLNAIAGKGFRPSAASGVFLMCRMVESGIMDKFLAENCANNNYKLCAYKDQLPNRQWIFMWNPESPLYKTGGWEANEAEYQQIEKKILTTPKYLALFSFKSAQASLRQLAQLNIGDGVVPQPEGSSPYLSIGKYQRSELKEYSASMQNEGYLNLTLFNVLIVIFTFLTGAGALLVGNLYRQEQPDNNNGKWRCAFVLTAIFLCCNAAITATFSTVIGRFNSRVFWVLPFLCLLYLLNYFIGLTTKKGYGRSVSGPDVHQA